MNDVLKETRSLYDLGFAIHWLHSKSKRPTEKNWTKGNRKSWDELKRLYRPGFNVGVRLGTASKLSDGRYLGAVDCDVKSTDPRHLGEMTTALAKLGIQDAPSVVSGRGNGSRHLYVATNSPLAPRRYMQSGEKVAVLMPSVRSTPAEIRILGTQKTAKGYRLRPAWEISIMGEGQQVVLPSSIHPDSGKPYRWKTKPEKPSGIPLLRDIPTNATKSIAGTADGGRDERFIPCDVDLLCDSRGVPDRLSDLILSGRGCTDRSVALFGAARDLARLGFSENEILSVLSDRTTFLGNCAYDHVGSGSRARAVKWLRRYTTAKGVAEVKEEKSLVADSLPVIDLAQAEKEVVAAGFDPFVKSDRKEVDWRRDLDRTGKDGLGPPKPSLNNTLLILRNAVSFELVIRNRFSYCDLYGLDTPWGGKKGAAIRDTDCNLIREWVADSYRFDPGPHVVAALDVIAEANAFHPVKNYLDGLEWDGVERINGWLKNHLGARGSDEYLAEVFRKWMVAAVARIYEPGTQFDWMLIFEGIQGTGKSTFFRNLAGGEYFSDWLDDLRGKDAAQGLRGVWIHEMGELASLKKTEVETVKAFLSRRVDRYRPTFGKLEVMAPRQCVFAGSTNRSEYLRDDTGNRRFVIVRVGNKFDHEANNSNRDQLWAEAKALYEIGEPLELSETVRNQAAKTQASRIVEDDSVIMGQILLKWRQDVEEQTDGNSVFDFERLRLPELFEEHGPFFGKWRLSEMTVRNAAKALKALGSKRKRSTKGVHIWVCKKWQNMASL